MTQPHTTTSRTADGLVNVATGLGTRKSKRSANQFVLDLLNDWASLDAAYQSNWIARTIVDVPARDMTRNWRDIKSADGEEIAAVEKQLCIPQFVEEAIAWARLYGGSGILMLTGQDLSKPLNLNRVKKGSLERVLVFDRWDMSPQTINTWNVLAPNYLQPEFYVIRGGSQIVHYTHFARFFGERLPLRWMAQTQGFGDSVLRKCLDDIMDMVAAKDGIAELMQEANIDVITREGLTDELSTDQDDAIIKRYEAFSLMKSNINMALLDGDEKLDRQTLNLGGVAPIIEQFMTWISGCAGIPVTKIFGTSAKGMNATGEGDMNNYYDFIRGEQTSKVALPMRTLDEVLVRSATGSMPDDFDYVWNPLGQVDELQQQQASHLRAQRDRSYLEDGIVTKSQIQRELQSSETYQFEDEAIDELEEMENANMFEELPDLEARTAEKESADFVDAWVKENG